jgi:mitochondrial fission protein ELM1
MSMRGQTLDGQAAQSLCSSSRTAPRVCVLFGSTRGDNAQLLNLAQALGWPFEVKGEVDSALITAADRLAYAAGVPLRRSKPLLSSLLWPDLIVIAGGRRVVDALRIKAMSEGRSRIVCLGRPWADLDLFDLVITTPQYRLPDDHPNVLMNAMPLNQPDRQALAAAAEAWRDEIAPMPKPWIAVLVGGDSGSCRFARATGAELAAEANRLAQATGGSLLISTSVRTPKPAADALFEGVDAPRLAFRFDKDAKRNPHLGFLALADRFIVTSDSASMIAEAAATGRPVSIFEVPLRRRSRWMTRPRDPAGLGARLRRRLTIKGLWTPARDMNAFRRNLFERGYVQDPAQAEEPFSLRRPDDLELAVQAVRDLFPSLGAPSTDETTPGMKRSPVHGLAIAG